jgi:hypothetical protein
MKQGAVGRSVPPISSRRLMSAISFYYLLGANMLNTTFSSTFNGAVDPVDALRRAVQSGDLATLSEHILSYNERSDALIPVAESLAKRINSHEVGLVARRFSWRERGAVRWAVVLEFILARANRILLVPTDSQFKPVVLKVNVGQVGEVCSDCPKLMATQVGRIVELSSSFMPPPPVISTQCSPDPAQMFVQAWINMSVQ